MQQGVVFLVLAMSLTPGLDGLAKVLSMEYSPFLVCFLRYFAAGCVAVGVARVMKEPIRIPKEGRASQLCLTALLVGSMTCLVTALSMVPLALATGGFLIAPLVSTLLSTIFLKETLTAGRIFGSGLSLIGAAIISKPEAGIELGSVFALVGGVLLGTYLVVSRGSEQKGGVLSSLAVQCLFGSLLLAPLAFWNGLPALTVELAGIVLALGCLSAMTHFLTVLAFEKTDAAVLSPFLYFNLVAAIAVGFFWFGEIPSGWATFGLMLIVLGGICTILPRDALKRVVVWKQNPQAVTI